jgi:glycosyltransferase involved in cell wall biosynthesis
MDILFTSSSLNIYTNLSGNKMKLSVIIPCFNHGLYIQDALESVSECRGVDYEVIIIDDGSTETDTIEKLHQLKSQGFQIITQPNLGPASARNAGISAAVGKYILTLDADNKVHPNYIKKAVKELESGNYDIVYGKPIFFGENIIERKFKVSAFIGNDLFINNSIDTCAIFKKEVWTILGGYDEKIPYHGNEDWEFWLHAYTRGLKFKFLNEGLYYYRILSTSLISKEATDIHTINTINHDYILKKHFQSFKEAMTASYQYGQMYNRDIANPFRASLKYLVMFFRFKTKSNDA